MEQISQLDYSDDLDRFARVVWGNPKALRRRLPQGVEFIDLSEYIDAFQCLSSRIFKHEKVLVRDEYRAALQTLQTDEYKDGAYVTGQPGIGKTYFLIYLLVHLLGQKQPVALQDLGGAPFYILFKETVTLHSLADRGPLYKCNFVWALSDSNAHVNHPPGIFVGNPCRIRIIQTTSPDASRWKEWSKQSGARCYIMDVWSDREVKNLAMLLELNVERMATLAGRWGNIPRTLLEIFHKEDWRIEAQYYNRRTKAVTECSNIIDGGMLIDFPDAPSPFYFFQPMKLEMGTVTIARDLPSMSIPTRTLRQLLAEGLQGQSNLIKLQFYNTLHQPATTRQAAGFMFESWFHSFFSAGREIQCQWVAQGLEDNISQLPTRLQGSTNLIPATQNVLMTHKPPYYWVPPHPNFPGIDGALVLGEGIFVFQVTISSGHRSPIEGLQKLRKSLLPDLKKVPWRVVFVGAERDPIEAVATHWAGKLCFPSEGTHIPVAWSEVDPVQKSIIYRVYRDEGDPFPKESDETEVEGE